MLKFIERNTPKVKDNFILKELEADGHDRYEIYSEGEKIVLAGSNNLSIAMAYYRYLNEFCGILIVSGDYDISGIARTPLPDKKISYEAPQKIRARMSYENFALEGNFWGFDRWEKEIDFMAMHGINTALQPIGFEAVVCKTLEAFGMTKEFCLEFVSGPAFLMHQVTGNLAGLNSVNSEGYVNRKLAIGKLIMQREKELGITPLLPAAIPTVPFSLRKKHVKMDIFKAPAWYNIPPIFYIKPDNAYFDIINRKFLAFQQELLGDTDGFFFEPIYDTEKEGYYSYLTRLGKAIDEELEKFKPESVCYIHASSTDESFFKEASAERYTVINDNNSDWLNGLNTLAHIGGNKYGRTGLYGDIDKLCKCPFAEMKANSNVLGTSLDVDTFKENPFFCAAALETLKRAEPFDADEFIALCAQKRYETDAYNKSILELKKLCYNTDECAGSVLCARPSTKLKHTAPYDTIERQFDFKELYRIVAEIIESNERKNDSMRADLQSFVRQILSELLYPVYLTATEFFRNQNAADYEKASNLFLEICEDMDKLMKTRKETDFFTRIDEARQLGDNKAEKQDLEINFILLHTVWGPLDHSVLYDTFWREWGGLIKDYYAQRWFMYFRALAAYFDTPKKLKDNSKKQPLDRNEYKGSYQLKRLALFENNFIENYIPRKNGIEEEDTLEVAAELMQKYSEVIKQF